MRPTLWDLLRRSYAQFHVGLGSISPADAEAVQEHQEALKPGVWYPGHGVIPRQD